MGYRRSGVGRQTVCGGIGGRGSAGRQCVGV